MSFSQPGTGGDTFDLKTNGDAWMGALMLVWPISLKPNFDTGKFEPTDVVECDIALIDRTNPETGKPLLFKNAFLFSKGLVANTRGDIGGMVLGRLVKRQFANGVGWSLDPYTPQDEQIAQQYLVQNPRNSPSQPSSSQQGPPRQSPPQEDPWVGMNTSPPPQQQSWGAAASPTAAATPTGAASPPPPQQQSWGAPPAASPAQAAPPPAPSAPSNGMESWPAGLADFLRSRGVDPAQVQDESTARMIAASLPQ
ncbi:hypothetical protein C6N75_09685 [Streptomyces solincola]|uniref:Uncharacterized protein n=1 Tax=Streptomyces solincola TaxID=2100817 RepID=A0A2S9PY27_9ACTN|nr:hypothetical protein [Streptomyces solincola]PRH79346.1 hypothetical protein C6N75_09685 [Streptomyces solincola]